MKAIVCNEFGPLEDLQYIDVDAPQAKAGQNGQSCVNALICRTPFSTA